MALLPKDPKAQKALGAIIVSAGLLYAFHTYWYTPKSEELVELESRVETLETRNRQAQVQAARGGRDLEERNAIYERYMIQLEGLIPASEEVPSLVTTIQREAIDAGVRVSQMNPEPDEPGEFYTKRSWGIQVIGDYHGVGRFLTAIASLPRIIRPIDLQIEAYEPEPGIGLDFEAPVTATFRIETYVLSEIGGPPPADLGAGE